MGGFFRFRGCPMGQAYPAETPLPVLLPDPEPLESVGCPYCHFVILATRWSDWLDHVKDCRESVRDIVKD